MRGLKPEQAKFVAAGLDVASFTDAWIETYSATNQGRARQSHLLQMRGLKQCIGNVLCTSHIVASFTDAWIETPRKANLNLRIGSHLLQMRGLKHCKRLEASGSLRRIFYRCVD